MIFDLFLDKQAGKSKSKQ